MPPGSTAAQAATEAAPEAMALSPDDAGSIANYAFSASSAAFTALSGATVVNGLNANDVFANGLPIGFTFYYMGVPYTTVSASSNGFLSFATIGSSSPTNTLTAGPPRLVLAPLWDDLDGAAAGQASYQTTGSPGSRVFTFQWLNWEWNANANAAVISFQARLYEADGRVEFVYRQEAGAANSGSASIGIAATATGSGSFLSLNGTSTSPTASATSESTTLGAKPATGQVYTFTPPAQPAAPANLTFTGVTQTGMTLNWDDNSSTEAGFQVLRSTDGANYIPVASTGANANSLAIANLLAGQIYTWQVFAISEGAAPSGPASGSQATSPAGEITCSGVGGNWSAASTWLGGILPSATDNVTIANGCTVTIDANATVNNLTVGTGATGILQFEATTARMLTVNGSVTIASGGAFESAASGTTTTHLLSVGANLANHGTLDFSTNANTAGAELRFVNATNNTMSGTGTTTDLRLLTIGKGSGTITAGSPVLEIALPFTVRGAPASDSTGFLNTATFNGILKLSGTFTYASVVFPTAAYSIPSTGGFWLNNPNFTVAGQDGSPTLGGLLRITDGAYNVGTSAGNSLGLATGSSAIVEGGSVNTTGRLAASTVSSAVNYTQSGGVVTTCTVGHTSTTYACFDLGTSAASLVAFAGGTIVVQIAGTGASGPRDYRGPVSATTTGGTLQLGNASSGAARAFYIQGAAPNLVISNASAGHTAALAAAASVGLNATINASTTLNLNGYTLQVAGNLTNNGTLNGATASSRLSMAGSSATTFANSGTVTTPLDGLSIDNPAGVTLAGNPLTALRVNLFRGLFSGSGLVTLGNGGATAAVTQIGFAGLASPGGSYAAAPTFNAGTGGVQVLYLQESVGRTTGLEIPPTRSVANLTINNTNGVTLAGGGLAITGASGLALTAGLLHTSPAHLVTLGSSVTAPPTGSAASYVNGPLAIEVNSAANTSRTFAVGDAGGWRPVVLGNFHSNGALQTYTVSALPGPTGGAPVPPLAALTPARFYRIQNTANIFSAGAATVQLSYGPDDNLGNPATARIAQANTAGGAYTSRGGSAQAAPAAGIASTTAIVLGDDYFVLANEQSLPVTWDGGAGTANWGDAANWNPDGVPDAASDVNLISGSATAISVDGSFSVNNLALNQGVALGLGSHALAVNGAFSQVGGAIDLGGGTLEVRGDFARAGGTFTAGTGAVLFSGAAGQSINCSGVAFHNLTLQGGGAGNAKTFTAGNGCTVDNDFTTASMAQLALSAPAATTFSIGGNLSYGGIAGGANIASLTFSLTGAGKAIGGAAREAPAAAPGFEMNVTVASGASYSLQDNIAIGAGRTLLVNGRLDAGTYTLSGAGLLNVAGFGILGTAQPVGGVGATVLTTGANTYANGSIVEYNAAGSQVVDATTHPANAMIQTGGSGVKTLNGNKTITGSSGSVATKGMIYVKAGSTFADGGQVISAAGSYANVIVLGAYQSTGSGGISYESSPYGSTILAVDGTTFGDLSLNFNSSTNPIYLRADTPAGTSTITFRNVTFGGAAGTGTAGGTLQVTASGTTPVVVTGNVSLAPAAASNSGGGFGGTTSTAGAVTVHGNIVSTSSAATQPIFNNSGANTLILAGTSPQTIDVATNTAILADVALLIDEGADVSLAPVSGAGRSYRLGGNLTIAAGSVFRLGQNTLSVEGEVTNNGRLIQIIAGPLAEATSFLTVKNAAATATRYYGLELTPTSPPWTGDTTVIIAGDQQCPNITNTTVQRCYEVTPASAQLANIKFYFTQADMAPTDEQLLSLGIWNYHAGGWNPVARGGDSGTCATGAIDCFVQGNGIANYSPFAVSPGVALGVTLAGFAAEPQAGQVLVTWETASELTNEGFNLYRSASPQAPETLLAFVPSQAPGASQGASYRVADTSIAAGQTYWYWLEDVSLGGATTLHGPVSATVNTPTAVTLSSVSAAPAAAAGATLPWLLAAAAAGAALVLGRRRR